MAAPRLSDEQKAALVERYRGGEAAAELATAFGCSAATVTRVVKAALDPEEYERLKQGRGRVAATAARPDPQPAPDPDPEPEARKAFRDGPEEGDEASQGVLAIDDADDFGDDSDPLLDGDGDGEDTFMAVPVLPLAAGQELTECRPLEQATLPASAYMLVDKTVELEAKPLRDFPELGQLPPDELEQRALLVFANPRQAKQLCGRSQRVIKLPDPLVLHRTARYLVAQGITRVVLEGSVYALPGSDLGR